MGRQRVAVWLPSLREARRIRAHARHVLFVLISEPMQGQRHFRFRLLLELSSVFFYANLLFCQASAKPPWTVVVVLEAKLWQFVELSNSVNSYTGVCVRLAGRR